MFAGSRASTAIVSTIDSVTGGIRDQELDEVDAFLADSKTLAGIGVPLWQRSTRPPDWEATWGVLDSLGVQRAALRFRYSATSMPSVSLVFKGNLVWRVDIAPDSECKINPPKAYLFGLPQRVCGPHEHAWADNRAYVAANGFGHMPFRRPISDQARRLPQMLADFASRIKLDLAKEQRQFDVPPQAEMQV